MGFVALLVLGPTAQAAPTPTPTAAPTATPSSNPCDAIDGVARDYCERGQTGGQDGTNAPPVSDTLDPLQSLADGFAEGAAWVVNALSDAVTVTADVDFTNASFRKTYALVFAASSFLVILVWLWAVVKRAVRGAPLTTALSEAIGLLWVTVLVSAFTPLILYTVVTAVDGLTEVLAGGSANAKTFDAFGEALTEHNGGGPIVKIVLSVVSIFAAGVLWIELAIRAALLYVGAVLGTVVYSGLVDKKLWPRVRKWVGIMAAIILIKPVVVIVLQLASALTSGGSDDSLGAIVSGLSIIIIAIIVSVLLFRLIPGMGDEIVAARRDSYDPASRQSAAVVTRPVTGITQGINTHAARPVQPSVGQSAAAGGASGASGPGGGIAAHASRPATPAPRVQETARPDGQDRTGRQ
ncbi:hypothetical protein [Streptomyces sp. A012304]|uniref:hypothetical protein n=1 Tax=Streptomyces sp. A012304 TaxID=375446 RepID=UPI0022314986|nr:hypothetical protein [Streptomyces sp. A012304]GKQ36567.1 hypothetical protein ALMP_31080 [Streptomyces sp. A012304]